MSDEPTAVPYWPFFCEENAWRLLTTTDLVRSADAEALIISNRRRQVACWSQRAADPSEAILWDYHVVVAEPAQKVVWDPESRIGPTVPMARWLAVTFRREIEVREPFRPRFRCVPRAVWTASFATDRSHMKTRDGRWRRPPPPWDPPNVATPMNLPMWLDQTHPAWITRAELEARWALGAAL